MKVNIELDIKSVNNVNLDLISKNTKVVKKSFDNLVGNILNSIVKSLEKSNIVAIARVIQYD